MLPTGGGTVAVVVVASAHTAQLAQCPDLIWTLRLSPSRLSSLLILPIVDYVIFE